MGHINVQGTLVTIPEDELIFDIDVQKPIVSWSRQAPRWPKTRYEPEKLRKVLELTLVKVWGPWFTWVI